MSTPETPRAYAVDKKAMSPWIFKATHETPFAGEHLVKVYEAVPVDAEIERLQRAQAHEIAMRLRVERKHIAAPEHLPTPEEVNRQRERAERGDAERERLLDLMERVVSGTLEDTIRAGKQIEHLLREYGRLGKEES